MRRIRLLDDGINKPSGFDLDDFLKSGSQGALMFGSGKLIRLKLRMDVDAAAHLHDTQLSLDQQIEPYPKSKGHVLIRATVENSPRLTWWLRGFAEQVEVLQKSKV